LCAHLPARACRSAIDCFALDVLWQCARHFSISADAAWSVPTVFVGRVAGAVRLADCGAAGITEAKTNTEPMTTRVKADMVSSNLKRSVSAAHDGERRPIQIRRGGLAAAYGDNCVLHRRDPAGFASPGDIGGDS
jgi:hypothetical protein